MQQEKDNDQKPDTELEVIADGKRELAALESTCAESTASCDNLDRAKLADTAAQATKFDELCGTIGSFLHNAANALGAIQWTDRRDTTMTKQQVKGKLYLHTAGGSSGEGRCGQTGCEVRCGVHLQG